MFKIASARARWTPKVYKMPNLKIVSLEILLRGVKFFTNHKPRILNKLSILHKTSCVLSQFPFWFVIRRLLFSQHWACRYLHTPVLLRLKQVGSVVQELCVDHGTVVQELCVDQMFESMLCGYLRLFTHTFWLWTVDIHFSQICQFLRVIIQFMPSVQFLRVITGIRTLSKP